jgi:pimeloyl-ACP methyl ester carboxylesterase
MVEPSYKDEPFKFGPVFGILTTPLHINPDRPGRVVIITHGQGGHKDYCYHKLVAYRLALDHGIYSFRFDFRGSGDSDDVEFPATEGRSPRSDYEDLDIVAQSLSNRGLELLALIGHSRGSATNTTWLIQQWEKPNGFRIKNVVNCSGRFDASKTIKRLISHFGNLEDGFPTVLYRRGKTEKSHYPRAEAESVSNMPVHELYRLPNDVSYLSIYGLEDTVVPVEESADYANILKERHTLKLIPGADHNFYGQNKKESNYNPLVAEYVSEWLSPDEERDRFLQTYRYTKTVERFKDVAGISNFRDFGAFPSVEGKKVREGVLFRSANVAQVEPAGMEAIIDLGIKTVFDLRSDPEADRAGVASIPGVKVRRVPVFQDIDLSPEKLAERYKNFFDPLKGFEQAYKEILTKGGASYREIFLHLRDRPHDGILVHCTAGKDRTGVFCSLLLLLLGVSKDVISREYELTTIGLQDELPRIYRAIEHERHNWSDSAGMLNMLSSKYEAMAGTLLMINREFGGARTYIKNHCGLTDKDLDIIISNLTVEI